MDKNPDLQKQAKPGEIAIKGTKQPDVIGEPVAPAKVDDPLTRRDILEELDELDLGRDE